MTLNIRIFSALFCVIACGCSIQENTQDDILPNGFMTLYLSSEESETPIELMVEVTYTPEQRERGMMHRTEFGIADAMVFNFENESILSFWMKNTLIPLDILFFDANGDFVSSATMAPCDAEPCPIYTSAEPAAIALEVPAGFVEKNSIGKGWKVSNKK
jgi:uncharacterized membrane protein (UPF0127 family)